MFSIASTNHNSFPVARGDTAQSLPDRGLSAAGNCVSMAANKQTRPQDLQTKEILLLIKPWFLRKERFPYRIFFHIIQIKKFVFSASQPIVSFTGRRGKRKWFYNSDFLVTFFFPISFTPLLAWPRKVTPHGTDNASQGPYCSVLSLTATCSVVISLECWLEPRALCFGSGSLLMHRGRQCRPKHLALATHLPWPQSAPSLALAAF